MTTIKKIADFFFGKKRAAQEKKEQRFFNQYGEKTIKLDRLYKPAHATEEFLHAINSYMLAVDGFKPFTRKDIKVMDVFTADGNQFIDSIFAIPRRYGCFYVSVGGQDVFLFRDNEAKIVPAKHFRIYLKKEKTSEIFARCIYRRGKILATGIYSEWQSESGHFYSSEIDTDFIMPCPIDMLLKAEF